MIKVFIPDHIKQRSKKIKKKWVKLFYYRKRRKTEVLPEQIDIIDNEYDAFCVSLKSFQRNTFYKLSQLSKIDQVWNYYAILKEDVPDEIFKKSLRHEPTKFIGNPHYSGIKKHWKGRKAYNCNVKQGKITLTFD